MDSTSIAKFGKRIVTTFLIVIIAFISAWLIRKQIEASKREKETTVSFRFDYDDNGRHRPTSIATLVFKADKTAELTIRGAVADSGQNLIITGLIDTESGVGGFESRLAHNGDFVGEGIITNFAPHGAGGYGGIMNITKGGSGTHPVRFSKL